MIDRLLRVVVPHRSAGRPGRGGRNVRWVVACVAVVGLWISGLAGGSPASAQGGPTMLDPNLAVRTIATGLVTPTTMAFLGADDLLVLEKNTGRVQRVVDGVVQSTVLDLAVNFGSERGLLGIALHPNFPTNPGVYLYWTESTTGADTERAQRRRRCSATGSTASCGTARR